MGEWSAKNIVRVVGGACIAFGLVLVFPLVGAGSGADPNPGSAVARTMSFQRPVGIAALVLVGIGLVILVASWFLPSRDD